MSSYFHWFSLVIFSIFISSSYSENVKQWQIQSRIVGGSSAVEKQFPYHVSLRNKRNNVHLCGGAIISEQFIITAAHCLFMSRENSFYGVVNMTHATDIGTRLEFSEWILHPEFSAVAARKDIALIRSKKLIVFSTFVKPIWLPRQKPTKPGIVAIVSGWGRNEAPKTTEELDYRKSKRPKTLQYKETVTMSYNECVAGFASMAEKSFENWRQSVERLYEDSLCARNSNGTGCCIGDSGGPLVVGNKLIGVVSWSAGCAQGFPDIYTDIYPQISWIDEKMAEFQSDSE